MIIRYTYGTPWTTEATVKELPVCRETLARYTAEKTGEGLCFTVPLGKDDVIFGLGQAVRGINKRGFVYRSWDSDEPNHSESTHSLYGSHNLLLFRQEDGVFGLFFDDPGLVTFDLGFTRMDEARITSANGDLNVYVLEGDSLKDLAREFRELTGRSYMPPRWGLGYIQSRWGYASDSEVRTVVREHRTRHIPLDGLSMDIDYMQDFRDFTWNHDNFPDLKSLADDMRAGHIHLVPIMDAGIKELPGDPVYDEGLKRDAYCKKEDGTPFIGAVWPGRCRFPDFLREDVRQWFGSCYRPMLEAGIEGWWNDMNEPALFYTPETLQAAYDYADSVKGQNLGIDGSFALKDRFVGIQNNPEDYRRFYHTLDGKTVRHDRVHNLYGMNMLRASAQGMAEYDPDKRFLLFGRSTCVGSHRVAGMWQGDNASVWSHILMNLRMLPSLNLCGYLYTGADLGGFGQDVSPDLLLRWLELGIFTPLMRNHSAHHTRDQEIYRFENWEDMRNIVTVRYALLPYLYSELLKAVRKDGMMFRPLAFDYPEDETALRVEDQVMLGDECMIAPVYEQNARGRHVYLPEDMTLLLLRSAEDWDAVEMTAGHYWVEAELNEALLFVRAGKAIPMSKGGEYVEQVDWQDLTLVGSGEEYELWDDDGVTTGDTLKIRKLRK